MIVRTLQGPVLKKTLETLKDLVKDVNISFTKEGLSLTCFDFSHISMHHFKMRASGLEHYECPRDVMAGVDTGSFHRFLKHVSNRSELRLDLDTSQGEPEVMTITLQGADQAPPSKAEMFLLSIDEDPVDMDDREYDTTVCMRSDDFRTIITDMAGISDTLTICSQEDGDVVFSCKGQAGSLSYKVENQEDEDGEGATRITQTGQMKEDFSMRHVVNFTKATDTTPTVWLFLQKGNPLMVKYEFGDLGELIFVLAPKVDDSDEENMEE